jgi:ABC-type transporter Mla subunit MlaD
MHYNKMKLAVGLFVITLTVVLITLLYLLLQEKGTFDKRFTYYFNTPSANSFNVGMPLKFSGFEIGVIDKISLRDDGSVHMAFSVTQENQKWINESTILTLKKPLIGSAHIEISSGLKHTILAAGSTLKILINDDINGMVSKLEPVIDKMTHIIENIDKITTYLAKDDSDLMQTVVNINKFSKKLADDRSLLTSFTGDKESTKVLIHSLKQSDALVSDMRKIMKNINKLAISLDEKLVTPSSISITELNAILKDVKQKLDAVDTTVKSFGSFDGELADFKESIDVSIQKSNQIMDKVDALMQDEDKKEILLP